MHKEGKWAKQIIELQDNEGKWDMGKTVSDKLYFPLSDDWRKKETREADCTERIGKLMTELLENQK